MTNTKLHLPYIASIPYNILADNDIPPAAKIFFGCLSGLAIKNGYVFGTTLALAEMMNTSESTIERWLNLLEKKSHISRDTTTTPHKNSDITKAKKFEWSKDRKIYICKGFSNNFTDTVKNNGYNEPVKNNGYKSKPSNHKELRSNRNTNVSKEESKNKEVKSSVDLIKSNHEILQCSKEDAVEIALKYKHYEIVAGINKFHNSRKEGTRIKNLEGFY